MTFHSSSVLTCGSAGLCLNSDIWGSISLQWHPGGPMCLERRLFVQARSCIANGSRRTLQPHVAARSERLLHLQHREGPDELNCGSLWMKTSPDQRFTMQATDVYKGVFPYTDSAYSWQWINKVSSFDTSLHLQPLTDLFPNRKWINDEMGKKGLMSYLWVKSLKIWCHCKDMVVHVWKSMKHSKQDIKCNANLEVWYAELVVGGEVVGPCGGCHHFVPCLLAGLLSRCRDQPKLCHGSQHRCS